MRIAVAHAMFDVAPLFRSIPKKVSLSYHFSIFIWFYLVPGTSPNSRNLFQ
jgi:hypothetical protein